MKEQKLLAVKIRKVADIINKIKKINKIKISESFLTKLILFVCNQWEIADF